MAAMLSETYPPLRCLADVEDLERVPLEARVTGWDFGESLLAGCRRDPDKWALHYVSDGDPDTSPVSLRYGALHRAGVQAANLFHSAGIGPTDAVVFAVPTTPELVSGLMGAFLSGVAFPVNWMLSPAHLLELVRSVDAKAIVALGPTPGYHIWEGLQSIRDDLPEGIKILSVPGPGGTPQADSDFATQAAAMDGDALTFTRRSGQPDDICAYLHSGGTTGAPKVVALTQRGFAHRIWATNYTNGYTQDEVVFLDGPMFHVGGLIMRGLVPIANGNTAVIPSPLCARDRRYIANYWKFVERYRVTRLSGVPTTLSVLLKSPPQGEDISSLKNQFATGSTPVPVSICKGIEELLGIRSLIMYGMTENAGNLTLDPRDGPTKQGSVGLRLPYTEMRSVQLTPDNHIARDSNPSEIGAIVYRSPGLTAGYVEARYNDAAFVDGWFNSGDLGHIDGDGYIWLTGRAKDVIIRGGHNIDPGLIEEALLQSPDVVLAAAVGMPDAYAGEVPVAYVQLAAGATATPADLLTLAGAHISERSALPKEIFIIDEIPLTGVGKPRKVELRHDAAQHAFTQVLPAAVMVQVADDAAQGTLATIALPAGAPADLDAEIAGIMGAYAMAWRIDRMPPRTKEPAP
ncbi:MAG: fatty-acyl-CoA synthase [Alphaproteobacteria bacterium]|jgi:fatty-acyl-CoA synthase